jgi:hypothetical protein
MKRLAAYILLFFLAASVWAATLGPALPADVCPPGST